MKTFNVFKGGSGQIGTHNITNDTKYKDVIEIITSLRARLLADPKLREPFLHILTQTFTDNSPFPADLKSKRPVSDHIPNSAKIPATRTQPPSDQDVVDFFTNAFSDVYFFSGDLTSNDAAWGETMSGRGEAGKEEIGINVQLLLFLVEVVSGLDSLCALSN